MKIEHVRQEHSHDCGIACMAMVMGVSLEEARAAYERRYPGATANGRGITQGITDVELDVVLAEEGYATARLYSGTKDRPRTPWPPRPWADAHIACVLLANGGHFVVLLRDGTVLDPAHDEPTTLADPRFTSVQHVAGVVRLPRDVPDERTRCCVCELTFRNEDVPDGANACPACGATGIPHDPGHDVTLTLNWQDIRCLANWAENYVLANKADPERERAWEAIKRRLRAHRPEGAAALVLQEELEDLRADGYEVTLHDFPPKPTSDDGGSP